MMNTGVRVRGLTDDTRGGSSPSRLIANRIRDCPYISVSTTLVIATSAPKEITSAPQEIPAPSSSTVASGASAPLSWSTGRARVATIASLM